MNTYHNVFRILHNNIYKQMCCRIYTFFMCNRPDTNITQSIVNHIKPKYPNELHNSGLLEKYNKLHPNIKRKYSIELLW